MKDVEVVVEETPEKIKPPETTTDSLILENVNLKEKIKKMTDRLQVLERQQERLSMMEEQVHRLSRLAGEECICSLCTNLCDSS